MPVRILGSISLPLEARFFVWLHPVVSTRFPGDGRALAQNVDIDRIDMTSTQVGASSPDCPSSRVQRSSKQGSHLIAGGSDCGLASPS